MGLQILGTVVAVVSILTAVFSAKAQAPAKVARVGLLSAGTAGLFRTAPSMQGFYKRMRELGWIDGQNLTFEIGVAEGKLERLPGLAAELVSRVDLIVAVGNEFTLQAAKQATSAMPIVMVAIDYDPVALGHVASLARPVGNVTGVFLQQVELTPKRLQLLTEALPTASRVAVLWDALSADQLKAAHAAASSLRVELRPIELRAPPDGIDGALREAARERADAALVLASTFVYRDRERIAQLALTHRIPTMAAYREYADAGGLITYGAALSAMFGRAAEYVDRILRGAKPADLPVEQPTKFELVINLKTAKAFGITIPPHLLVLADEVIQ